MNLSFIKTENKKPSITLISGQQVLKFQLEQNEYRIGRDRTWSHFKLPDSGWEVLSRRHAILRKQGEHYCIYDGDGCSLSNNGIFLNQQKIDPIHGLVLKPGIRLEIGRNPKNLIQILYSASQEQIERAIKFQQSLDLPYIKKWPVFIGRVKSDNHISLILDAPEVSREHALIEKPKEGHYILRDTSSNGIFINQKPIKDKVKLLESDLIEIGRFLLGFYQGRLELIDIRENNQAKTTQPIKQPENKQKTNFVIW